MSLSGTIEGSFTGISSANMKPRLSWSATQDIAGNYSDITLTLYFWTKSPYYAYNLTAGAGGHTNTGNTNGTTSYAITPFDTRGSYGDHLIRQTVVRVYHNTDGTKTCWLGWDGNPNASIGTYSFGQTITLDTIPRRATITNANANLTIGNNLAYTLVNNGSFYVRMEYWINGNAGWYKVKDQQNGTGTSGTFSMSSDDNNAMYSRMPNTLTASAIMRAYTYSDSGYSTQVGDYHDCTGTVSINQTTNKPTFTTYTVENVDKSIANTDKYSNVLVTSSTETLLGSSAKIIKNYSKARAVVTSANKMIALNYATAIKYRFLNGVSYNEQNYHASNTVNLDIDNVTTAVTSLTAYDSRGLTTTVGVDFGFIADYSPVSLWGMTFTRDNGVDSETKLAFSGLYWKEYFGGGTAGVQNTITAHYRYKETTEVWDAQTWNAITPTDTDGSLSFDDYINGDLGVGGFDSEKSYDIEVRIFDKLTNVIIEGTLGVGIPLMDWTSSGVAILNKYDSEEGGVLQVLGKNILSMIYPIGSLYYNATDSTNPATLLGFGTWEAFGQGRVLVGKSTSGTFETAGATGGAERHTLTIAEMPEHNHTQNPHGHYINKAGWQSGGTTDNLMYNKYNANANYMYTADTTATNNPTGGGGSHNNLQPYVVVYCWKRTG